MAQEGIKTRTVYLTELWINTRARVSHLGLGLVCGQVVQVKESLLHPEQRALPPCTGSFTKQYGLPCSHMLLQNYSCVVENGQRSVIGTGAFDLAWWDNTWMLRDEMLDRRNLDPRIIAAREPPQNAPIPVPIPVHSLN
ncbi:hypothetical protein BKA56DRAFT_589121 [Ilyonectria sp. MPI-CAGE-AT-0026]|nr:hypothetical protein BKA56DRAFT_589121 [Ilyonectria sp. MPI-CAGE-AT-0026]